MAWGAPSGRRFSAVVISAAFVVAMLVASCGPKPEANAAEFCAVLSDSFGLYVDNPVTQMGYRIGKVTSIEAHDTEVTVGFTIDQQRAIPEDVRAVVRSPSILADRALELVGDYDGGPQLKQGACIPPDRTFTPLSISEVIESADGFVNAISPDGSTNLQDTLSGIDQAVQGNGQGLNDLVTRSSALLDNPDQAIADLGKITRNMADLTAMLRDNRDPLKTIVLDMPTVGPHGAAAAAGAADLAHPLPETIQLINDLEAELGPELQLALDTVSDGLRVLAPHYKGIADILNPLPRFIAGLNGEPPGATEGGLAKRLNNHVFALIPYRPPLFRIPSPNGRFACGVMNESLPGSCADVGGQPYVVDVALLQYVLAEAHRG